MTSIDDLASEIMKGLTEYAELADSAMKKAVRKTAKTVKKEISENAPYAKIISWSEDGVPTFATPVCLPGAVSLSIDAEGENENFYADNIVYYVINNNSGYEGDLEVALTPDSFRTDILGETLDDKNVMVERSDAEIAQFAILFEINGDKKHMRYCFYCCSASRPATSSSTIEDSKEPQTDTLSLTASALPDGLIRAKTCENTDETTYNNWYKTVYMPTDSEAV